MEGGGNIVVGRLNQWILGVYCVVTPVVREKTYQVSKGGVCDFFQKNFLIKLIVWKSGKTEEFVSCTCFNLKKELET